MKLLIPLFILLCIGTGCSKSEDKDKNFPGILLLELMNGQVFSPGQAIRIHGNVYDDKYIAEIHIHVSNLNSGALLMDVHDFPGNTSAAFDQSITAVAGVNYRISILAKDRGANQTTMSVEVSCN